MLRKVELFDQHKITGLVSVIPDDQDQIVIVGGIDLHFLESLIKEIKKRDPRKRGEVRKYTLAYRVNATNDGVPSNWLGHIILLRDHEKQDEKNLWYGLAPILIEKESVKNE